MHRGDLHAMLADLVPPDIIRQNHKLAGLDHRPDGTVRNALHQWRNRRGRRRDRRRRRPLGGPGIHAGAGKTPLHRPRRLSHRVSHRAAGRGCSHTLASNGGDRTGTSSAISSIRDATSCISSPARRNPISPSSPGPPKGIWRRCARPTTRSTRRCAPSSPPARMCINGRWWSATRCRAGWRATSRCWATPATR